MARNTGECNQVKHSAEATGHEVRAEKGNFQHPSGQVLVILLFRERLHDLQHIFEDDEAVRLAIASGK